MFLYDRPENNYGQKRTDILENLKREGQRKLFGTSNLIERKEKLEKSERSEKLSSALEELNRLIGLDDVKDLINRYLAFIKIQGMREKYSLKKLPLVMNMVFKGSPGTGKTTVARLMGRIFCAAGYLRTNNVVEASRVDLVGEYIGHTAQKTRKVIEEALGGVLFIDEAYALARGGARDFGKEAIDTLVKYIEDKREDIIIILAGYSEEMEYLLDSNPGLRSRFSLHIDFPDYSLEELVQIAELMYKEREYILSEKGKKYLYRILSSLRVNNKDQGNARTVRNIVEESIRFQAQRLADKSVISRKDLMLIERKDIEYICKTRKLIP